MNLPPIRSSQAQHAAKQRGLVLFFALIALVAMSLAALALIRSVDTSTMIAGNLAFRQAATTSSDAGLEAAIAALAATETANAAKNIFLDATHTFNISNTANAAVGYYSSADPALDLTANATWVDAASRLVGTDASGNTVRFIAQRMCRNANQLLSTTNCLFSGASEDTDGMTTPLPSEMCPPGPGCPQAGQNPQYRVTTRVTGPRNTVSYIQALVY